MATKPSPPEYLSVDAQTAYARIVDHLWSREEWFAGFDIMAELAASACALYKRIVCDEQALAVHTEEEIEEYRMAARRALVSMQYFSSERARLGVVDANGYDQDLIEICRPTTETR